MNHTERIEINPQICNGRPVVVSTRITVDTVLSYIGAGDSVHDILAAHPRISPEDVLACIEFNQALEAVKREDRTE